MPSSTLGCRYPPSVQLFRQRLVRYVAFALSLRTVGTRAGAREPTASLLANAPSTPRWRRDVSACSLSIEPSWLVHDVRLGGKNVATSALALAKSIPQVEKRP